MEFQWEQLAVTVVWLIIVGVGLTTRYKPLLFIVLIIAIIMFFMNPFRQTVTDIKAVERKSLEFNDIPEKVIVESTPYEERRSSKMDTLKTLQEKTHEEITD